MKKSSSSGRIRLYGHITLIMFLCLSFGISFLHYHNASTKWQQAESELAEIIQLFYHTNTDIQHTYAHFGDSLLHDQTEIKNLLMEITTIRKNILSYSEAEILKRDSAIVSSLNHIAFKCKTLKTNLNSLHPQSTKSDFEKIYRQDYNNLPLLFNSLQKNIRNTVYREHKRFNINIFILFISSFLIITLAVLSNAINNSRNLSSLLYFISKLEKGERPQKLHLFSTNEFEEISAKLNSFIDLQEKKISFLKTIDENKNPDTYHPETSDILGNEIKVLAERLHSAREQEEIRLTEENKRSWISDGIAQFAEILQSERNDVKELSFKIIQKIVNYLDVLMGTIFLTTEEEEETPRLEAIASYAYDRKKYLNKSFDFGEGLPGTCALEKEKIYVDDIPEDYSEIISGVGQSKPKYALLIPLKINNEVFGILEIASLKKLNKQELDLLDTLAESIASTLMAAKSNQRTAQMLYNSQEESRMLKENTEELKQNLKKITDSYNAAASKNTELNELCNALNTGCAIAEFNQMGRYINVNDNFLKILRISSDQVLGKTHAEFAVVDRYSDEYKKFWSDLKNGNNYEAIQKYKLYNGKEIFLFEHFIPIKNNENHVYKILCIVRLFNEDQETENLNNHLTHE